MDFKEVLSKYYNPESRVYNILTDHSRLVAEKAIKIAETVPHLNPDITFIEEAAMLHDIGIFETNEPDIDCNGKHPYIFHGFKGREILDSLNLPRHALVAERHTGAGISKNNIIMMNIGLPERDMLPVSIEEIIICYADKFFSKNPDSFHKERSFKDVVKLLKSYGKNQADRFLSWALLFGELVDE